MSSWDLTKKSVQRPKTQGLQVANLARIPGLGLEEECEYVRVIGEVGTFECEAANDDDHRALCHDELGCVKQGIRDTRNRVE